MKKLFSLLVLIFIMSANAQFKISGEIQNFNEKSLLVRINQGPNNKIVNKITTDKNGKFTVNIPEKYHGMINLTDDSKQAIIDILTDNEEVAFKAEYINHDFQNINYTKGKTAIAFNEYQTFQTLQSLKTEIFPVLKSYYNSDEDFFKAIIKEEQRIENLNPSNNSPLLDYYSSLIDLTNTNFDNDESAFEHKQKIMQRLVNDNDNLESSGLLSRLVLNYIRASIFGSKSQAEIQNKVKVAIDQLIDQTIIDTPRGQYVLSAVFEVLPENQFGDLLASYYDMVNALTCELTDELKTNLYAHNMKNPGAEIPNIKFNKAVNGYESLFDIKADKKIILFWASWCPACMSEMPYIEQYYENFKKEGGEIVAISLDYDLNEFENATKNYPWINYTELLRWDTQGVESFGIQSTPTLFLVDKDNKLIKRANHISELFED